MKVTMNLVKCKDEKPLKDGHYVICDMFRGGIWYTTMSHYTSCNGWNTTRTDASYRMTYEEDDDKYWAKEIIVEKEGESNE